MSEGADYKKRLRRVALGLQTQVRDCFRVVQAQHNQGERSVCLWRAYVELSQIDCNVLAYDSVTGVTSESLVTRLDDLMDQFRALCNYRFLPLCIRYLLLCLKVPYARLTALHFDSSSVAGHNSTQGLLDLFVDIGNRMSVAAVGTSDPVYQKMLTLTGQILEDSSDDWQVLINAFDSFKQYNNGLTQHVRLLQQRLKDAEHGRLQGEQAMRLSQQVIEKFVSDSDLPVSVVRMLQGFWVQVLGFTVLEEGVGSKPFERQCTFVSGIVNHFTLGSNQGPDYDQDFQQLMTIFETYVHRANISDFQLRCLRQDFRNLHLGQLNVINHLSMAVATADPQTIETYRADRGIYSASQMLVDTLVGEASMMTWASLDQNRPARRLAALSAQSLAFVSELNEGDWLMLWLGRLVHEPVQVLFYDSYHGTLSFVNHQGARVCEKTREDLAIAYQQGQLFKLRRLNQVADVMQTQHIEAAKVRTRIQILRQAF